MSAWDVVGTSSRAGTSRRSCCGWPFRPASPWDRPAPARSPTRSSSAASAAAGRSRGAGPGELARALVEVIEQGGGEVLCDRRVVELISPAAAARASSPRTASATSRACAVLSTIHVKDLVGMAPAGVWGEDFRYAIDTYDEGVSAFAAHYATTEPPRYPTRDGDVSSASRPASPAGPEDILRMGRDVREGRLVRDGAWLLFPAPTVADPSRAPGRAPHRQDPRHAALRPGGGRRRAPARRGTGLREEIADRAARPSAPRGAQPR